MVQNGTPRRPLSRSFSADDIRVRVKDRQRLRVPSELDVVLKCEEGYYAGQIVNLSCSGVFLTSQMVLPANSELVLFLSNRDSGEVGFLEAEGEVMWMNEGSPGNELSRGMGLRFERDSGPGSLRYQLDCIVNRHLGETTIGSRLERHRSQCSRAGVSGSVRKGCLRVRDKDRARCG